MCKKTLIEVYKGQIVIHNSSFNETEGEALGMVLKGLEADIYISNSLFSNTLETHLLSLSGFIHIFTSALQFTNSSIHFGSGQTAGAIYSTYSRLSIYNSTINSSKGFAMIFSTSDKYLLLDCFVYQYIIIRVVTMNNMKGIIERKEISEKENIEQAESEISETLHIEQAESEISETVHIEQAESVLIKDTSLDCGISRCLYLDAQNISIFSSNFSGTF